MDPLAVVALAPLVAGAYALLVHLVGANSRPGFDDRELRDPSGADRGFNRRT